MSPSNNKCRAKKWDGGECKQPAGFKTFHEGYGECFWHHKESLHTARKLYNGSCMPKSIYEECALIELRDNPGVDEYYYEPTKIPYNQQEATLNYIPDILVTYTWKEPSLIEVKKIPEMCDSKNLAKFKSADAEARKHGCNFRIWGYEFMHKSVFTYQEIFEKCCF